MVGRVGVFECESLLVSLSNNNMRIVKSNTSPFLENNSRKNVLTVLYANLLIPVQFDICPL